MKRQQGFSLVEFMIAIAIGLVLMTGVVQMFLSSKQVFSTQQGISRIQETGRLAMEFLAKDVRQAGYMGCISRTNPSITSTLNDTTDELYDFETGIEAFDSKPEDLDLDPAPADDTPILVIRSASTGGLSVVENNTRNNFKVENPNPDMGGNDCASGICTGDVVIATDCAKARIFQVTNVQVQGSGEIKLNHSAAQGTPGNKYANWGGEEDNPEASFSGGSEIIKVQTTVYYIAESTDTGRLGLWQKVGDDPAYELLEGVEDMNLEFGVSPSDALVTEAEFQPLADVGTDEWGAVRAVRAELLVRSTDDNVSPEKQTYTFGGEEVTADDKRIRQVFTSTIGIRSRLE